jgi:phospholipid-binding lipoprotein MlaA
MRSNPLGAALRSACLLASLLLAACAGTGGGPGVEEDPYAVNDPLETVNRGVFTFNLAVDDYVLKPTAQAYRTVLPQPVRNSVQSFLRNLGSPVIMFNDFLQGEPKLAGDTFIRMWLNTILGLGGIMDVGSDLGIPYHTADFGQTFGVWGVGSGPYLMLPLLGPSDVRDAVGFAADTAADPFNGLMRKEGADAVIYARGVVGAVDTRSRNIELLDRVRSTSLDYYATIRSLYTQRRAALIRHEAPPDANPGLSQ